MGRKNLGTFCFVVFFLNFKETNKMQYLAALLLVCVAMAPSASAYNNFGLSPPPVGTYMDNDHDRTGLSPDGVGAFVFIFLVAGFFFFLLFLFSRKLSYYISDLQEAVYKIEKRLDKVEKEAAMGH